MRIRLSNELSDVINEFGPKVFEDFNEVSGLSFDLIAHAQTMVQTRILVPSASAPPSGSQGVWQRKGRDPQGRLLNHPMVGLLICQRLL